MKRSAEAGLEARIARTADEKQTIVNLMSAGLRGRREEDAIRPIA